VAGIVLGSEAFARSLRHKLRGNAKEQAQLKRLAGAVPWSRVVSALEEEKGECWEKFSSRYGDWGRDAALWLGRRQGRLRLAELGKLAGGMDYGAVSQAINRFTARLETDGSLAKALKRTEKKLTMLNV